MAVWDQEILSSGIKILDVKIPFTHNSQGDSNKNELVCHGKKLKATGDSVPNRSHTVIQ